MDLLSVFLGCLVVSMYLLGAANRRKIKLLEEQNAYLVQKNYYVINQNLKLAGELDFLLMKSPKGKDDL